MAKWHSVSQTYLCESAKLYLRAHEAISVGSWSYIREKMKFVCHFWTICCLRLMYLFFTSEVFVVQKRTTYCFAHRIYVIVNRLLNPCKGKPMCLPVYILCWGGICPPNDVWYSIGRTRSLKRNVEKQDSYMSFEISFYICKILINLISY